MLTLKRRLFGPANELGPTVGKDVYYLKRPLGKVENDILPGPPYDHVANKAFFQAVIVLRRLNDDKRTSQIFTQTDLEYLTHYMDAYDRWRYRRYTVPPPPPPPVPPLIFPLPIDGGGYVCQGIHYTAGLVGNVAIDFCDRPNDPVLCVEGGVIQKLSGHPPSEDTWDTQGVFGWSIYVRTDHGYVYYYTHLGKRQPLTLGQRVHTGEVLGWIGDQRYRPDHTHIGVTSPLGISDATKRILAVAASPRVKPQ